MAKAVMAGGGEAVQLAGGAMGPTAEKWGKAAFPTAVAVARRM